MTDMEKMQATAISNAKAMYKRSSRPPEISENSERSEQNENSKQNEISEQNESKNMAVDTEKIMIILLILLLGEDMEDSGIILALIYSIL